MHDAVDDPYTYPNSTVLVNTRTVRISRDGNPFGFLENLEAEAGKLFKALGNANNFADLTPANFAKQSAHFLSELNAIHAFREGNCRAQNTFFLPAGRAGRPAPRF